MLSVPWTLSSQDSYSYYIKAQPSPDFWRVPLMHFNQYLKPSVTGRHRSRQQDAKVQRTEPTTPPLSSLTRQCCTCSPHPQTHTSWLSGLPNKLWVQPDASTHQLCDLRQAMHSLRPCFLICRMRIITPVPPTSAWLLWILETTVTEYFQEINHYMNPKL